MQNRENLNYRFYFGTLIAAYVIGVNLFLMLKLLGASDFHLMDQSDKDFLLLYGAGIGGFIACVMSVLEVKVFSKWKRLSFMQLATRKYLLIVLVIIMVNILFYLTVVMVHGNSLSVALLHLEEYFYSEFFISIFIYLIIFSILMNMVNTITEYMGREAVLSALFGKYHHPTEDDIAFIFIDLQSSTTLAESLGHLKYSQFIDLCFQTLTESIYDYSATVYQFVGDEAVLLWRSKDAEKTLAPIELFYNFQIRLESKRDSFMSTFGVLPVFKASIHAGDVAITEIRSVKTDIVYHGDVVNTCARIIEKCKSLERQLLVSSRVAKWLDHHPKYEALHIDESLLKGKVQSVSIYEVRSKV